MSEHIRICMPLAPGDCVVLTAALESLHRQYPGKYLTDVDVAFPEVFDHNPRLTWLSSARRVEVCHQEEVNGSDKRPVHYLEGMTQALGRAIGVPLTCHVKRPLLYLSDAEKEKKIVQGDYWLLNASYKLDMTVKQWRDTYFQAVINHYKDRLYFVQVGGSAPDHRHARLEGVIDAVGKYGLRGLFRMAYHSQGALTVESLLNHVMAAFDRPCVCLASGLFPLSWLHYPRTKLLSTQAVMPCCSDRGCCWRFRVEPLNDGSDNPNRLCLLPVEGLAACMELIKPDEVIRAIEAFTIGRALAQGPGDLPGSPPV